MIMMDSRGSMDRTERGRFDSPPIQGSVWSLAFDLQGCLEGSETEE